MPNIVYEARCRVTGLSYVGHSYLEPEQALAVIAASAKWSIRPLCVAIKEHGLDSFDVVVLGTTRWPDALKKKRIAELGYWPDSYNLPPAPRSGARQQFLSPPTAEKE